MADVLELGRHKVYEGPLERRPRDWIDEPAPAYDMEGDHLQISDRLRGTFPREVDRMWLIDILGLGETRADSLVYAGNATIVDFRRHERHTRVILRWTVGKEVFGRQSTSKITTEAYGFVTLSDTQADTLCHFLREACAPVTDPVQAAITAAWHRAYLEPEQVEKRRHAHMKAHGLDDESVAKQRENVAYAVRFRFEAEAKKKP